MVFFFSHIHSSRIYLNTSHLDTAVPYQWQFHGQKAGAGVNKEFGWVDRSLKVGGSLFLGTTFNLPPKDSYLELLVNWEQSASAERPHPANKVCSFLSFSPPAPTYSLHANKPFILCMEESSLVELPQELLPTRDTTQIQSS